MGSSFEINYAIVSLLFVFNCVVSGRVVPRGASAEPSKGLRFGGWLERVVERQVWLWEGQLAY